MPTTTFNIVNDGVRENAVRFIRGLTFDKKWIVEIKKKTKKRTNAQNKWMWAAHKIVAQETGHEINEIHEIIKSLLLPKREFEFNGVPVECDGTTTKLTKDEWGDFMLKYSAWAAQYGIILPHPEDQGRDV